MACADIRLNDIGTVFELTIMDCDVIVDLAGYTSLVILFKKPDKTTVTRVGTLTTDGSDGKMQYVSVAGDLDLLKSWQIQARVTLPTGTWSSDISKFTVKENLDS